MGTFNYEQFGWFDINFQVLSVTLVVDLYLIADE